MPCGCNDNGSKVAPNIRRETVDVPTGGGQTAEVRLGDTDPSVSGWLINFATETKVGAVLPQFVLDGRDRWIGSAVMHFGDENGGLLCNNGGRIYAPFPTVTMSFFDANGSGAASPRIQLVGRPLYGNQGAGASTLARGISQADIANTASNSFDVPLGAVSYWVARPDDGGTVEIKADAGSGDTVENYVLSNASAAYPLQAPSPWRDVPIFAGDTASAIEVENTTGGTQLFQVHWLFDLAALR